MYKRLSNLTMAYAIPVGSTGYSIVGFLTENGGGDSEDVITSDALPDSEAKEWLEKQTWDTYLEATWQHNAGSQQH